jgi:hypothetical protein
MIITGDDILIEYVDRILVLLKQVLDLYHSKFTLPEERVEQVEVLLPKSVLSTLTRFVSHKIWSTKLGKGEQRTLVELVELRHREMIDRRFKILKASLRKQNPEITAEELQEQLKQQDLTRDKIVTRISTSKIEKMVKQSNQENKIEIVSILIEGQYVLPSQMTTSSGKSVIDGTLQSLKLLDKIIKQTDRS